jgi:hypothetical protein
MKAKRILRTILLVAVYILLPLLGICAGFLGGKQVFTATADGVFVHWKRLAAPPARATALLAADPRSLIVQTEDGIYFAARVPDCLGADKPGCWEKADHADTSRLSGFGCSADVAASHFRVPAPPIQPAESRIVYERGGEWNNETHYVRGQDGAIWVWTWGNFSMGMLGPLFLDLSAGMLLGFVLGLALASLLAKYIQPGKPRSPKITQEETV